MERLGVCRFCGQLVNLDDDYGSEGANNKEAAWLCDCPQARNIKVAHEKRQSQLDAANEAIDSLFHGNDSGLAAAEPDSAESLIRILKAAVSPIVDRQFYKISIDVPGGIKATITRSGKDKVSVERSDAKKQKLES